MGRIGFLDIKEDPVLYIFEKKAKDYELKDTIPFSCSNDYSISIPKLPADIDEFYLNLPLSRLNFRILEIPFSDREKIVSVLPFELEGIILNGSESVIIDGIVLESIGEKNKVVAVYIEKAVLSKILDGFKRFGIDPKVITSIELCHLIKDFDPEKLLRPIDMEYEERLNASINELKSNTFNLRRGEFSYTRDIEKTRKSLRLTAILSILTLIMIALFFVVRIASAKRDISMLQGEMNRIYSEIFPVASRDKEDKKTTPNLYQLRARIKELKDKGEHLIGISPLNLLLDLSGIERGAVVFNEISMDKGRITLRGEAGSFSDVQKIKEDLTNVLSDVNISGSKTSVQGRVLFTIMAQEKKG
jgi:type II secretory pathway component PulL